MEQRIRKVVRVGVEVGGYKGWRVMEKSERQNVN